ncbi:MAG: LysR family transcriptional regulator, partial [Pseudomonadota bacterium]
MDAIDKGYRGIIRSSADLGAFVMVCRAGSLTRAAQRLGISQPSLSKRMRNLETSVAAQLLVRTSTGVAPTVRGRQLLDATADAFDLLAAALERQKQTSAAASVLISVDFAFASYWLLPRLPRLREDIGQIDISILASQRPQDAEIDRAITIFMGRPEQVDEDARMLFAEQVVAVGSPALLSRLGAMDTVADLATCGALLHLTGAGPDTPWLEWKSWFEALGQQDMPVSPGIEFNTYEMVLRSAASGQGIALGWDRLADAYVSSGELVHIL